MLETQQEMIKENLLRDISIGNKDEIVTPRSGFEQYQKKGVIQRMREELAMERPLFEHSMSNCKSS